MYGKELKEKIKNLVAKATGETLHQRIESSLPAIHAMPGLSAINKSTIFRWFKDRPFGPKNATAARSAIAKTSTETIDKVRQMIEEAGGFISLRTIASHTGIHHTTVADIIHKHLEMHAFKFINGPEITPARMDQRFDFCMEATEFFENNPDWHRKIIWTDESYFELVPPHNRQNNRCYSTEQPNVVHEHVSYPKKLMMWCGLHWQVGVIGPFWLEESLDEDRYHKLLEEKVFPRLTEIFGDQLNEQVFQQDGAPAHTAFRSLAFLYSKFNFLVSKKSSEIEWPAGSPDLTVMDYYFFGRIKSMMMYHSSIDSMKSAVNELISLINVEEIRSAIDQFPKRIEACLLAEGGNFNSDQLINQELDSAAGSAEPDLI